MLLLCNRIYPWICIPKDKYTSISRVYKTAPASKHDTKYFAQFINKTPSPIYFKNYTYSWIYVCACACMLMCAIVYLYEGQRTTCKNRFSYYVGPQKILSSLGRWQVADLAQVSCQPLLLLPECTLHISLSGVGCMCMKTGGQFPEAVLPSITWSLGTELKSSGLEANTSAHWLILLALRLHS